MSDNIKNFKAFLDDCFESFESIVDVEFKQKDKEKWDGNFNVNEKSYGIIIEKLEIDNKIYTIKFYEIEGDKINFNKAEENNIKISLSVLGTINSVILEFINEINPDVVFFYTSDKNKGRKNLYLRFSKKIQEEYNYYYFDHEIKDKTFYFICKNNFDILTLKKYFNTIYSIVS